MFEELMNQIKTDMAQTVFRASTSVENLQRIMNRMMPARQRLVHDDIQVLGRANVHSRRICLKGLDPDKRYQICCDKEVLCILESGRSGGEFVLYGDTLMNAGIHIGGLSGDFVGALIHVKEIV